MKPPLAEAFTVLARERDAAQAEAAELRAALTDLRESIARDIEAERDHFAQRTRTPREHPLCRAYDDAARIARGTQ